MSVSNLTVAQELAKLEDRSGRITPEQVVEVARDPSSPLHPLFVWDDGEAAEKYRLDQARGVIRSCRVELRIEKKIVKSVAYVHAPAPDSNSGYRHVSKVASDPQDAREVLVREFSLAASVLRRAREIASVIGLESKVDAMIQDLNLMSTQVATPPERRPQ
jgi:hypothetical protein